MSATQGTAVAEIAQRILLIRGRGFQPQES